jgi:two-component system response regulator CpxR
MKEAAHSVLVIDDDASLCALLAEFFLAHGIHVDSANDGRVGLAKATEGMYQLILLDVMLPLRDGFDVLKHVRRKSSVPIIMLTARTGPRDRVAGLNAGADDYIAKPFEPQELLARVRAVLRRTGKISESPVMSVGPIRLNLKTREAWRNDVSVRLTSIEFDILDLLMRNADQVVSRDELASTLYHRDAAPFERWIDVHICHLRKKLDSDNESTKIQNVRGVGYRFVSAEVKL